MWTKKATAAMILCSLCVGLSSCATNSNTETVAQYEETTTTAATEPAIEYQELENPDFNNVMWGMSKQEVKVQENVVNSVPMMRDLSTDATFGPYEADVTYSFDDNGGLDEICYSVKGNSINELYDNLNAYGKPMFGTLTTIQAFKEISNGLENGIFTWDLATSTTFVNITGTSTEGSARISIRPYDNAGAKTYKEAMSRSSGEAVKPIEVTVTTAKTLKYSIPHGEVLDENVTGDTLIIKAKITPSFNNHSTISQNFFNLEDLIKNQGCSKYDEIQYWAVADMTDGSESKVISFTAPKSTIDGIKDGSIEAIAYLDEYGYVTDVYILPSLLQD